MIENIFVELSLIIIIAVIVSAIMRLLKQPLIIGYIITGVIASPTLLNLIESKNEIGTFAQLGVALLLFVVGLNLDLRTIKNIGKVSLITGIGQVLFTSIVGFFILKLLGFTNTPAIYISIALTFSSTIIITTLLLDKKELETLHGKISVGFLIVQDIIAIFILMTVSSLQSNATLTNTIISTIIKGSLLLFALFIIGNYILPKITKVIAKSQEFLLLFSIGWAFIIGSLFNYLNFSIEIGALLAGVTLALTSYRQEISSKMKPIKDFFIVLFFISLGSQIIFKDITLYIPSIIVLSLFILIGNPFILMTLTGLLGYKKRTSFFIGLTTAQISEFSIILIALVVNMGNLSQEILSLVTVVGLITIAGSSYLIMHASSLYNFFSPYLNIFERKGKKIDEDKYYSGKEYDAILFGYNRIGYDILESFKKLKKKILVLDYNPEVIETLVKQKIDCVYGDAYDSELLNDLALSDVKLVVSTIPELETNLLLIKKIKRFPKPSLSPQQADWVLRSASRRKRQESKILERPKNCTPEFLVSLIAKSDDAAELRGIKPNLAIKNQNKDAIIIVVSHQIDDAIKLYEEGATYVLLPHFLGGKHVANMIEEFQFNTSKFLEQKALHLKDLIKRKKLKHEHPKHERD